MEIISVSELNRKISDTLNDIFDSNFDVSGEISNLKISNSHAYFVIKDESAAINAIIWKYTIKKLNFANGDKVTVNGKISLFNKTGNCNLIINSIKNAGIGDIYKKYVDIRNKYDALGYFGIKKQMPSVITNIGIITSIDGAALQDFLFLISKNDYIANIKIKNCQVQGINCPKSVAQCLELLDQMNLDVIIIMRGGGSFEDLIGFSDPIVIEAIYKCKTFIISAIGHESDHMLSDYVADLRAPTPSISAEMLMRHDIVSYIKQKRNKHIEKVNNLVNTYLQKLIIPPRKVVPNASYIKIMDVNNSIITFENIENCKKMKLFFPEGEVIIDICLSNKILKK